MPSVSMTVNGKAVSGEVEGRTLLVDFLRDTLRLTGTHVGCDTAQCGACTVLIDGIAVNACLVPVVQVRGADVKTVEGLAEDGRLHPVQQAFIDHDAFQCAYAVATSDRAGTA